MGSAGAVRVALLQMTSGIDPSSNARTLVDAAERASGEGAEMLFTPEMSGLLDRDRSRAARHVVPEWQSEVLESVREAAVEFDLWIALGSLAVRRDDGRWANRSFLVRPDGVVTARYDKIHMFDVDLASGEAWRESSAYAAGAGAVAVDCPLGRLGMTVCYDVRFPALFDELGRRGCDAIAVPAAFTVPTGAAHWHLMLRARAIEASAWVIAAAQSGHHEDGRATYGHSLVVDPWGEVVLDMGPEPGLGFASIDPARTAEVRRQVPSLANKREIPRSDAA